MVEYLFNIIYKEFNKIGAKCKLVNHSVDDSNDDVDYDCYSIIIDFSRYNLKKQKSIEQEERYKNTKDMIIGLSIGALCCIGIWGTIFYFI